MATQLQPPASADSAVTMSLVDRFSQILDAGRQIASGLSREAVYGAVRNQAMRLLRSDQCLILEMPESADAEPTPASALDHGQFSRTIVADAVRVERPVLLTEDAVATGESLVLSGARSVLCAPISVRGRIVACFYATHFRLGSLFGETEARLAEFITTLAGTALENAEGFEASAALAEQRGRLYSEAQEAIRARDEFLSIVTHELRTPLTSLGLQLSTLQRSTNQLGASAPEMQERVGRARRQFDRFQELINRLLDVSRAVEGRLMPEPEPMDLAEAAREVAERFAEELRAAKSELVLSVPEHVPGEWDRMRIDQILLNLVSNAIKFGAGKPIEVTLTTPVDRVLLRVRDHGIGIAPQDQPRIFERFERAVSTRHYGGFGLGLWITRALIQAMQGTIHVESSPGQGATFTVDLPRHPAPDQTTPVQEGSHRGYPEITSMPGHDPGRGG